MQSQGLALLPEPKVGPSTARVSTKESCVDPLGQDPNMGDLQKCRLYVDENPPCLVALGRVYEASIIVHNIPLGNDQVKVGVKEVRDVDAYVPVPTQEDKQRSEGPAKPADRPDPDVNPLYLMTLTILQFFLKPLVYNDNFPLYIKHEDLSEIAHGIQCLNIFVIQLWILHMTETSMRAENAFVYGFLESQSIQKSGSDNYLKEIINMSIGFNDSQESKFKARARWIVVKYFTNPRPSEPETMKAIHIQWTIYYLKVKNETLGI
ncbi:hypothetical protein GmHk_11G033239 [Glycine max]|nr:hypothetical protein GmHk_11G033239 [Glycine max]